MGRAARWFKGIFRGTRKQKENAGDDGNSSCSDWSRANKRRWSIRRSGKDDWADVKPQGSRPGAEADPGWIRSYAMDTEKERSKHAIAVAAATAAAADAAVAAAHAAVAVVRLTSQGRGAMFVGSGGRECWAAARIQAVFRGYLARKALRALKGLVKLQALVRGYLVRKRAAATLHSMQALIRAQTAARSQRARCYVNKENKTRAENWTRRSIERFDDCCSDFHSERISASYDPLPSVTNGFEESPKIVEIDTYKPRTGSRRMSSNVLVERRDDYYPRHAISSPLPCPVPARLSIPESRYKHDPEWWFVGEECKFPTAHNTPRFAASSRRRHHDVPGTPARSVCGAVYANNHPNYMANTKSFDAKVRSQSAPKQRPWTGSKKRLSLNEIMASRMSVSGVRMIH